MGRATDSPGGETARYFPTDRFFVSDGMWFFATREQVDMGPYARRADAVRAVRRYLDTQATMARIRERDPALNPDNTFDEVGVAQIAKQIRTWNSRTVGNIRGDEQRLGSMLGDDDLDT